MNPDSEKTGEEPTVGREVPVSESEVSAEVSVSEPETVQVDQAPVKSAPSVNPKLRRALVEAWEPVVDSYKRRLVLDGFRPAGISRYIASARTFLRWAVETGITTAMALEAPEKLNGSYREVVAKSGMATITKNMNKAAGSGMIDEVVKMSTQPPLPPDEVDEEGQEEEYEDEQPPARKPRGQAQAQPQQVVFMTNPRKPRNTADAASRRTPASRLVPQSERVRVSKRGSGGKRIYLSDYTTDEIGNQSLSRFIKEYVDPDFADPSGQTTYEVSALDANDRERGTPTSITIESTPSHPPDDTITQARNAIDLVRDLREMEDARSAKSTEMMDEAKKKAAGNGDMNSLMMLMMMQRMDGGAQRNDGDIALKLVERLQSQHGLSGASVPLAMPPMPPMQMMPPPPPPENTLVPIVTKLLEVSTAPKPEPKSFTDQMKEMMVLKEMFSPPPNTELLAILRQLATNQQAPQATGGIEGALRTFDQLTNVVKTLAPQVNMGGLTGAIQNLLTPQLAQAVGNMFATGITKAQETMGKVAPAPMATTQAAAAPTPPRPSPLTENAVALLRAETDDKKQVVVALQALQALYNDPMYTAKLEPALQGLLKGDLKPARATVKELLQEIRPDLANADFVDKVVAALITSAGGTPPPELLVPSASPPPPVAPEPEPVKVEVKPPEPVEVTASVSVNGVPVAPPVIPTEVHPASIGA